MRIKEVVVITGASAGVGRATAHAFARRHASVALIARPSSRLEATAEEVRARGGDALVLPLDVADSEQMEAAAKAVVDRLGDIDIWINNAMVSVFSPVADMTAAEFHRVTEVTYLGYVYGTLAALRRMRPRNRGTIVQVGSALSYRAIPLQSAYCASKHAVRGFTDALRCELMHEGSSVRVTMVHLPALNTPHFSWARSRLPRRAQPVPPIYQPRLAADAIVWAAHHPRREVLVGAMTSATIWASKLAPALADRYLAATGYDIQQYDGSPPLGRDDNLLQPSSQTYAVEGDFGERAHGRSTQWQARKHARALLLFGLGAALLYQWRRTRLHQPTQA